MRPTQSPPWSPPGRPRPFRPSSWPRSSTCSVRCSGAAVADTIAGIVTVSPDEAVAVIGSGLAAAVIWNLLTWKRGLPSSSSHALVEVGRSRHRRGWHPRGAVGRPRWMASGRCLRGADRVGHLSRSSACSRLSSSSGSQASPLAHRATRKWIPVIGTPVGHLGNPRLQPRRQRCPEVGRNHCGAASGKRRDRQPRDADLGDSRLLDCPRHGARRLEDHPHGRPAHLPDQLRRRTGQPELFGRCHLRRLPARCSHLHHPGGCLLGVGIGGGRRRWRHVNWAIVREMGLAWLITLPASALLAVAIFEVVQWLS